MFNGELEADKSYFDRHCKGICSRGAAVKAVVIGFLKRDGKVFIVAVPNTRIAAYCCSLSPKRLYLTVLFISAATTVMTYWM